MRMLLLFCFICLMTPISYSQFTGLPGPPGPKGEPGYPGFPGQKGDPGFPGGPGLSGQDGKTGLNGRPGQKGDPGLPGAPGLSGQDGQAGLDGLPGPKGFRGNSGRDGLQGVKGEPGDAGLPGASGECVATVGGLQCPKGDQGVAGEPGRPGEPGQCGECEIDSKIPDFKAVTDSISKFGLAINYDFVRRVGQKYFVSYKERDSFSRAVDFCSQQGLELALPQNDEENNILAQFFGDVYKAAWINVNNKKAVGNFASDMQNRPLTFTKWGEGQPDRSIQDTGCTMLTENSIWRVTQECFLNAFIICQI